MTPISFDNLSQAINFPTERVQIDQAGTNLVQDTRHRSFFAFGAAGRTNAAIKADTIHTAQTIQSSLKEHFGAKVGATLFNRYIGAKALKGKSIAVSQLRALVQEGTHIETEKAASIIKAHMQNLSQMRPASSEIAQLRAVGLNPQRFTQNIGRAVLCLTADAFSSDDVQNSLQQAAASRAQLQQMVNQLAGNTGAEALAITADLNALLQSLADKTQTLQAQAANNPASVSHINKASEHLYRAAITLIDQKQSMYTAQGNAPNPALAGLKASLSIELGRLTGQAQNNTPASAQAIETFKNLPTRLVKELYDTLTLNDALKMSKGEIGKAMKAAHIEQLNKQPWAPVSRAISLTSLGQSTVATSSITPAQHIGVLGLAMRAHGVNGVCCSDRARADHAVNLARTSLTVPDAQGQAQTVFQGLRHAVNCAYGLAKDTPQRLHANITRTKEIFAAVLEGKPNLLAQARAGQAVELPIVSTSLMTPDIFRSLAGGSGAERTFLAEQNAAWQAACDNAGVCQIPVSDGQGGTIQVRVKPTVLTFSFGVNAGAQSTGLRHIAGGWTMSKAMNSVALTNLVGQPDNPRAGGMVAAFLATCTDSTLRMKVEQLTQQIKELWTSGGYNVPNEDPYRLPARIAVLSSLIDATPAFNCKSGKDRTGQMDVACKTLAFQVANGQIPPLTHRQTEDERHVFQQIAINSGNLEFQRMNTGLAGFKTKGVSGLDALFDADAKVVHRGMSSYVSD